MKFGKISLISILSLLIFCTSGMGAVYTDTSSHWAGADIEQLAAQGIITELGPAFNPENYVSRGQAVDWIVRMANPGDISGLLNQARGTYTGVMAGIGTQYEGTAALAVQSGILSGTDAANMNFSAPALRQEVSAWISRAARLQPDFTDTTYLSRFADKDSIDPLLTPYLIPLVRDGMISGNAGFFYPQTAVKKGELAALINRCSQRYLQSTGGKYTGPVSQTGRITDLSLAAYPNRITILNLENVQHALTVTPSSVIMKNGLITALANFTLGEAVSYSADAGGNLLVLASSAAAYQPPNPWTTYRGERSNSSNGNYMDGEVRSISEQRGELNILTNSGGKRYTAAPERFERKGVVYYIDDVRLQVGDEVRVFYIGSEIDYVELLGGWNRNAGALSEKVSVYKATLDGYDSANERLKLLSNSVRRWNGSSWSNISGAMTLDCGYAGFYDYDGGHLALKDLRQYEEETIYVLYDHEEEEVLTIRLMRGSETSRTDKVSEFSRGIMVLGDNTELYADYTASVLYQEALYEIEDVDEDSTVRVVYNRFQGENYAVIIGLNTGRSSGDSGEYIVYEGTLSYVDLKENMISLTNAKVLDEDRFRSLSGTLELFADDLDCYYQGEDLAWGRLDRYEDHTVFVVGDTEDNALHLVVTEKRFNSSSFSKIEDVDRANSNYLTLRDLDMEFEVDDSTIIVDDGDIIQYKSIIRNEEVLVVYENDGGEYRALVIAKLEYLY